MDVLERKEFLVKLTKGQQSFFFFENTLVFSKLAVAQKSFFLCNNLKEEKVVLIEAAFGANLSLDSETTWERPWAFYREEDVSFLRQDFADAVASGRERRPLTSMGWGHCLTPAADNDLTALGYAVCPECRDGGIYFKKGEFCSKLCLEDFKANARRKNKELLKDRAATFQLKAGKLPLKGLVDPATVLTFKGVVDRHVSRSWIFRMIPAQVQRFTKDVVIDPAEGVFPLWVSEMPEQFIKLFRDLAASYRDALSGQFEAKVYKAFRAANPDMGLPSSPKMAGILKSLEANKDQIKIFEERTQPRWHQGSADPVRVFISNEGEPLVNIGVWGHPHYTSCQDWVNYGGNPGLATSFALLCDPTVHVLWVGSWGEMKARVLVRILFDEEGKECLLIDRFYGDPAFEVQILRAAVKFAEEKDLEGGIYFPERGNWLGYCHTGYTPRTLYSDGFEYKCEKSPYFDNGELKLTTYQNETVGQVAVTSFKADLVYYPWLEVKVSNRHWTVENDYFFARNNVEVRIEFSECVETAFEIEFKNGKDFDNLVDAQILFEKKVLPFFENAKAFFYTVIDSDIDKIKVEFLKKYGFTFRDPEELGFNFAE